jgi:hypothetical protein
MAAMKFLAVRNPNERWLIDLISMRTNLLKGSSRPPELFVVPEQL